MVDLGSIAAAANSLRIAAELTKGFLKLQSMAEVQAKVIELQSAILSAQSSALEANTEQAAMLQRIHDLEKEVAQVKAWETEKQRYQMVSPYGGMTVYAVKKSMSNGEPPHYICANCYHNGKHSILQNGQDKNGWTLLVCQNPACKAQAPTGYRGNDPRKYAEEIAME